MEVESRKEKETKGKGRDTRGEVRKFGAEKGRDYGLAEALNLHLQTASQGLQMIPGCTERIKSDDILKQ